MRRIATSVLAALLLITMGRVETAPAEKPAPTECRVCNGKIDVKNRRFSVLIMKGIEASAFDDIGCAIKWRNSECAMRQAAFDENAVVYDHDSEEAIPIEKAVYVIGADIKTPHGYGIVVFKDREQAERFIAALGKGKIITYSQILEMNLE